MPLTGQDIPVPGKQNPMTGEAVKQGMSLFQQNCAMCHGSEAKGGSGPNLIESSVVRHDAQGDLIGAVLKEGRPDKGMPSFTALNGDQVATLVAFLHAAVTASDNRSAAGPARGYTFKRLLTGNAQAGKEFFNAAGRCAGCHSPTGDLAGIAKKYSPLELEGRILYPPDQAREATVLLPSGEIVKGTLLHQDAFHVAIMDTNRRYRSWALKDVARLQVEDPLKGHLDLLEIYQNKDIHDVFAYLETLQ